MYFKNFTPLNESWDFTMKNLVDAFTIPPDNLVKSTDMKLKRVEQEFNNYYKYDETTEDELLKAIGSLIKKNQYDPIDLPKVDRFHHMKLNIQLYFDDKALSKADFAKFYIVLYRELFISQCPSYFSKYTLLKFIGGRYIIFITFDEDGIEAVHVPVSENQFDLTAPIYLHKLKVPYSIFKK